MASGRRDSTSSARFRRMLNCAIRCRHQFETALVSRSSPFLRPFASHLDRMTSPSSTKSSRSASNEEKRSSNEESGGISVNAESVTTTDDVLFTTEEERRVMRKVDIYVLPVSCDFWSTFDFNADSSTLFRDSLCSTCSTFSTEQTSLEPKVRSNLPFLLFDVNLTFFQVSSFSHHRLFPTLIFSPQVLDFSQPSASRVSVQSSTRHQTEIDIQRTLDPSAYNTALALYFLGYVLFEVPSNLVLKRGNPAIVLPSLAVTWGVVSICQGFITSEQSLYIARFCA